MLKIFIWIEMIKFSDQTVKEKISNTLITYLNRMYIFKVFLYPKFEDRKI